MVYILYFCEWLWFFHKYLFYGKRTVSNGHHPFSHFRDYVAPCLVASPLVDQQVYEAESCWAVLISAVSTEIVQTEQDQICIKSLSGTACDKVLY